MARKISSSQIRTKLRQQQNKQRQAVNKYNQAVRKHNQNVRRAVNNYNNEVRRYNARVRAYRQKMITELNKFSSRTTIRYEVLRTSTLSLNSTYQNLEAKERDFENYEFGNEFLDLSEKENANSLAVSNALENDDQENSDFNEDGLSNTTITIELIQISDDLDNRWKGALFSLSPRNPDASRHFCTSAREIFIQILNHHAPDSVVLARFPECDKTENGAPTRRWKIKYILVNAGIVSDEAVDFVDEDMKNVLQLFRVFNDGTHGEVGKYEFEKLVAIKERVESGILYLSKISNYA
ncbi:hypothetical protein [Thiohalophilus sp.]|uniref:pPIWI-associating nuclease domain-containing protein n=1 Tax=Thiohalophilus sp. TaxID=3028392 RepID=UPI002ACDA2D5|nr:hypothetical protein [Thiohalophilus sp.]MDZ7660945.1 hypothetical protein [Thiohalophilus sp.]